MLSGFKTFAVGLGLAVLPTVTEYVAGFDWSFLGAKGGMLTGGVLMVLLRMVTTTPPMQGK